jgi:hypothetical protein
MDGYYYKTPYSVATQIMLLQKNNIRLTGLILTFTNNFNLRTLKITKAITKQIGHDKSRVV